MESIILASTSARRQELLSQIGVRFTVRSQDIDESIRSGELANDYVTRMAQEKADSALCALHASKDSSDTLVLAADTSVVCDATHRQPASEVFVGATHLAHEEHQT